MQLISLALGFCPERDRMSYIVPILTHVHTASQLAITTLYLTHDGKVGVTKRQTNRHLGHFQ